MSYEPPSRRHRGDISDAMLQLLERRLQGCGPVVQREKVNKKNLKSYPLSYAQRRLWFVNELAGVGGLYNVVMGVEIEGELEVEGLGWALGEVVRRHEVLRSRFEVVEGEVVQRVQEWAAVGIETEELEEVEEEQRENQIRERGRQEGERGFDLGQGRLLRARLLRLRKERHVLLVSMHHIVSDGWSMSVLVGELGELYRAYREGRGARLEELTVQYGDYAAWQQEWLQREVLQEQMKYWKEQLAELPQLELPTDRRRPAVQSFGGSVEQGRVEGEVRERLEQLGREEAATLYMVLLAGYAILLHRYTGQEEIVVGTPIANRTPAEVEGLIGLFVNTLVMRVKVAGQMSVRELIGGVRQVCLAAYAHQDVPFEKLVEEMQPERDLSRNPLFQVGMALQNMPVTRMEMEGIKLQARAVDTGTSKFDWTVFFQEEEGEEGRGLGLAVEYSTDLFESASMQRMVRHLVRVLEQMSGNADGWVAELELLDEEERRRQVEEWNRTEQTLTGPRLVHQWIEGQAEQRADAVAIEWEEGCLSYAALNRCANQLARRLLKLGAAPEACIAICLERSAEMIIAMLAVLKTGAAFLPLDPKLPVRRIHEMLRGAGVRQIVTTTSLASGLGQAGAVMVLCDTPGASDEDGSSIDAPLDTANAAYVIYTSGSTGTPKGVVVPHAGMCNTISALRCEYQVEPESRVMQFAALSFDACIADIFPALTVGATVIVSRENPANGFAPFIEKHWVNMVTLPPSFLARFSPSELPQLSTVIVAGEACPEAVIRLWSAERKLINAYGPTEASICGTIAQSSRGHRGIGRPILNATAYILDRYLSPVPAGFAGELYLGGSGVARGYMGQPALTAERFLPHPYAHRKGERLYRTGDIARYSSDGDIEFLGRADRQMKIRGYRIEPAEIENVLQQHAQVRQAAVRHISSGQGEPMLTAYVVPQYVPPDRPDATARDGMEIWPSVAEHFVYDELLYHAMRTDEPRNRAYRNAIEASVPGKSVVDIGTGGEAILARLCVAAGAKRVYALEILEESRMKAENLVERLGLSHVIRVVGGDANQIHLPELVDVCVSELVGSVAGSEGAAVILNNSRRFLKPGGIMIPQKAVTRIAAVQLDERIASAPSLSYAGAQYADKIQGQLGYPFDMRVCIKNVNPEDLVSTVETFEELDFSDIVPVQQNRSLCLQITRPGVVHGLLLWLALTTAGSETLDILAVPHSWLPVFVPVFYPGICVSRGDVIELDCVCGPSENGVNPDYRITGTISTQERSYDFTYAMPHFEKRFRGSDFYRRLFLPDGSGVLDAQGLKTSVRDYLRERVPDYMVPSQVVMMGEFPLTRHGKIDWKRLPEPERQARERKQPRDEVEGRIAGIWESVLGVEAPGVEENFFELGGHSLLLAEVRQKLQNELQAEVTMVDLFRYPTIAALAAFVSGAAPARVEYTTEKIKAGQDRRRLRMERIRASV